MSTRLLAFIGVAVVITVTPGPDLALVTRVVLRWERPAGWLASLGVVSGHLIWGVLAAIGVAALLSASPTIYLLARILAGAYLIWLGLQALISRAPAPVLEENLPVRPELGLWQAYRRGLVNDLLNPKIGAFYTTLLPQFISPGQPVILDSLALAVIMALIVALWLAIYVAVLAGARAITRRSWVPLVLERLIGVVLIGLGLHVWFST